MKKVGIGLFMLGMVGMAFSVEGWKRPARVLNTPPKGGVSLSKIFHPPTYTPQKIATPRPMIDEQALKTQERATGNYTEDSYIDTRTAPPSHDHISQTIIFFEDFEAGMPANWTVVDGNNDGYSWVVGTTGDMGNYEPPNYGTQYAYYSDDDAGSGAPPGNEELISPAVDVSGLTTLFVRYDWGFNCFGTTAETLAFQVRVFTNGAWGDWQELVAYLGSTGGDTSGTDTFDISGLLPADSVQFRAHYVDPEADWSWAVAVDNVTFYTGIEFNPIYDYLVLDLDPNTSSGPVIDNVLSSLGWNGVYTTQFPTTINTLLDYNSVWLCLGQYPNNAFIADGSAEANALIEYMNAGGHLYVEGGDCWYWDPLFGGFDFASWFGVAAVSDGGTISQVIGVPGAITEGMSFAYTGETNWTDEVASNGATMAFVHEGGDTIGFYYNPGTYRAFGFTAEFGGLASAGTGVQTTLSELALAIMTQVFEIPTNFIDGDARVTSAPNADLPDTLTTNLIHPEVTVQNNGTPGSGPSLTFRVFYKVTFNGTIIYNSFVDVFYLPAGSEQTVYFSPDLVFLEPGTYTATVTIQLADDPNPANNSWSRTFVIPEGVALMDNQEQTTLPTTFAFAGPTPNVMNNQTTIRFQLPQASPVSLEIYDATGRTVRTLVSGILGPGYYSMTWNGRDDQGRKLMQGVYFYRFLAGEHSYRGRILIVR